MSRLLYKFIVCSDVHAAISVNTVGAIASYQDSLQSGDVDAVFCCGDVMQQYYGLYRDTSPNQTIYVNGRAIIAKMASLPGLICAGNHSSAQNYGEHDGVTGVDLWLSVTGYSSYRGDDYTDKYIQTMRIGRDLFVSISDTDGNATYDAGTVSHVRQIIDDAVADGKRVFVFSHYPFGCTYDATAGTVVENTASTQLSQASFGGRISNGTDNGQLRLAANYPNPSGNAMLEMLASKDIMWFTGHCHNFWQIGHENGAVLYASQSYGTTVANHNYLLHYPYAHVCKGTNSAYMVNLPSLKYCLQDALVYVYDDKVEVRERQCTKGVITDIPGAYEGEVTGDNVAGIVKATAFTISELKEADGKVRFAELAGGAHTWNKCQGGITSYTATFLADGRVIDTVEFDAGASVLPRVPAVPAKTGYTGAWEPYTLADADITINAVYTANTYRVTFVADGVTVAVVPYQYGAQSITEPTVPPKDGYTGTWSPYTLGAQDSVSTAVYTPIEWVSTNEYVNKSGESIMSAMTSSGNTVYELVDANSTVHQLRRQSQ